jgi:hypothetical protein
MDQTLNIRRKLLQGSLAAPLVLTVSTASAQAASSFGKCLANIQQNGPFFATSQDAKDINSIVWYRQSVTCVEIVKQGQSSYGYHYWDPKLLQYINVDTLAAFTEFTGKIPPNNSWSLINPQPRWALVYFTQSGSTIVPYSEGGTTIITLQRPSGYLATSTSCHGSFTTVA